MYKPKVNDYVIWNKSSHPVEGWVYFVDKDYITIEVGVSLKDDENIDHCPIHKKTHSLVLCYPQDWHELQYIKSRRSVYDKEEELVEMVG